MLTDVAVCARPGYTPSASIISPQDLTICKKPDGSDFLLGQGTFGAVSASQIWQFSAPPATSHAACMRRVLATGQGHAVSKDTHLHACFHQGV